MPRPKKPGAPEPKKRSRNGCWPCKARKVKCGEERPSCVNCQKTSENCDYSIRLNWEGRRKKNPGFETILFQAPSEASSSSNPQARSPPDAASPPNTATPSHAAASTHPSSLGSTSGEPATLPRSELLTTPTDPPNNGLLPVASSFSVKLGGHGQDDGDEVPLVSPSLASPVFSLPRPHSRSISSVTGGYVFSSETGQAACPPPFKRLRYSVDLDSSQQASQISSPTSVSESTSCAAMTPRFPSSAATAGPASSADSPLTPAASSPYSDVRRMSVTSLLSGPPGPNQYAPPSQRAINARTTLCLSHVTTFYGVDYGYPDLDIGKNDDANAIRPLGGYVTEEAEESSGGTETGVDERNVDKEAQLLRPNGFYYRPVEVRIPRDLEPLPAKLRENPMNLLYFHHFMNHTAKALVPYYDQQSNPYRHVLPLMAVENDNLLSLMLAYSASHRAHLLNQPEPATRIALWVQDIFPALRRALNDPNQSISNANIATGIMLASLEIVSPTAFGYQIPWQRHLGLARDLIASRPDGIRWTRNWTREDQVRAFLWSWLAYLDVLGTLSGGRRESSTAWIFEYQKDEYEEEWDEIDCIMGMTTRCVYVLAKIAELAKECDALRAGWDVEGPWKPPRDIITRAWVLEDEARDSMMKPPQPCKHLHASGNVSKWDQREIAALNEAFHWAGLVHLHRRVLGKPSGHEDVQAAVLKIHACLDGIALGANSESSMLFPLFTAACETIEGERRRSVLERLSSMHKSGFLSVAKAQTLIEQVWETGRPWEDLLTVEFIG